MFIYESVLCSQDLKTCDQRYIYTTWFIGKETDMIPDVCNLQKKAFNFLVI